MGPTRRLIDLDPHFENNVLTFDCPCNRCQDMRDNPDLERNALWISGLACVPVKPQLNRPAWDYVSGEFPDTLTLQPSILIGSSPKREMGGCEGWHGYLTNGILTACE